MAELVFFSGTMDCGKSTLALQMDHNHRARDRAGLIYTRLDRAGDSVLSSRLGLETSAREVTDGLDFWDDVVAHLTGGRRVDYLICDEAQFYSPAQIEQLARLVDELEIDTYAFGITADFRTQRATHNARVLDGVMVVEGAQVVVGNTVNSAPGVVEYEVLCRRHYMRRMNSRAAHTAAVSADVLPLELAACPLPLD